MKFGLHYQVPCSAMQSPVQRYRDTMEQAAYAEALGFESVWPVEQHFNADFSIMPSPLLMLAALAERTRTLRLGVAIIQLPLSHPLRIAEEVATLDVLSNGRVEFGVGRGSIPYHFAGFGVPQIESRERFTEALAIIFQAWTQERVSYRGRFYQIEDVSVVPKPVQRPYPPCRVASNSRETFEQMGRQGLWIFAASQVNAFATIQDHLSAYRAARRSAGYDEDEAAVTVLVPTFVAESESAIRATMEPSLRHFLKAAATLHRLEDARPDLAGPRIATFIERVNTLTYEQARQTMALFETPEAFVERLHRLHEQFRMGRLICWFNLGGLVPHAQVMRSMELFAAKVMPHFA